MEGEGKLVHQSGFIFIGEFKQGICSTYGKVLYPNGNIYFGQLKEF